MDAKIEIKEQNPLSDDVFSQNEGEFFIVKTNSDGVMNNDECDVAIKTEIKSEIHFPEFCSQKDRECCAKHALKQISSETITCSSNSEAYTETEVEETLVSGFGSQNNKEFLLGDPVIKVKKYNSDHEEDNKIEIKVEPWWLGTETSSVCDDHKAEDLLPVKSSRLCMEAGFGHGNVKLPLLSAELSGSDINSYNRKDYRECESQESHVTEMPTFKICIPSENVGKCNDAEIFNEDLYWKQNNFIHKSKESYQCNICEKSFRYVSHLKRHKLIHGSERPHQCKTCGKSFTEFSNLNKHYLIHEGEKPFHCKTCDKSFTLLSYLKKHNLIHEGKKPHHCRTCDKSFTHLASFKRHNLIHEGKKPHQCKTCDKSFTDWSSMKRHSFIHEGKKPHQCKTCGKSFTQLSNLKAHNLIHEGKKPHQCGTCDKQFTQLSNLKTHNLIHKAKKPQ